MNRIITICAAILMTASIFAQTPEKMSYQAVIRDSADELVTNTEVGMQISILQGGPNGTVVYQEDQLPTTNENGLVSIIFGAKLTSIGDFTAIDWANGPYFIKTEIDPTGGTNYSITGTSQLMSVPYALHAKTAETVTGGITETDPMVTANFDLTDPADGDVLQYDASAGKWNKRTISGDITIDNTGVSAVGSGKVLTEMIADGTILAADLASDAVETAKIKDASVTTSKLVDGGVTSAKIADNAVGTNSLKNASVTIDKLANFDLTNANDGDLLQYNASTEKWVKVTPGYISNGDNNVGIGIITPDPSAELEVNSTTKGLLPPRMTETERDAISDPATGLMIFNTSSSQLNYYTGSFWFSMQGKLAESGIYPEGFVSCNGVVTAVVEVTSPNTGRIWMDRNLGASREATRFDDADAFGDLYQWGRVTDGHQCRDSKTITILSSTDQPGHGDFITSSSSPNDWRNPQNNNLWQGADGINNPCPSGYRIPTAGEWQDEIDAGLINSETAFTILKLPMAGRRSNGNGWLEGVSTGGNYWSGTVHSMNSHSLGVYSDDAFMPTSSRAYGYSVRCIKD